MSSWWSGCVLLMWWCGAAMRMWMLSSDVFSDAECRRRASPFKDWVEPSGVPSCLSSGLLRVEVFWRIRMLRLQLSSSTVAWTAGRCCCLQ
jgi:hypothetical protein